MKTMELPTQRKGKIYLLGNPIAFAFMAVTVCCTVVVLISALRLPDVAPSRTYTEVQSRIRKFSKDVKLGKLGDMVVEMLPDDLAFTVFLPSEIAFSRDLRLQGDISLTDNEKDNSEAILSRILGFSAVPRKIDSSSFSSSDEMLIESISGFKLYVSKSSDGTLVVNGVKSELVDLRRGHIVVHVMDGVIMDFDFQQSVLPDDDGEDQRGK